MACAGVTVYHALRQSRAKPGDRVAVLGVGGLGHLGVQFARAMGFETIAIARGADKAHDAKDFGGGCENRVATVFFGFLQRPGLFGGQVFVGGTDQRPDLFERFGEAERIVLLQNFADRFLRLLRERLILWLQIADPRNFSTAVFRDHRGGAAGKIAETVGEVGVVALDEGIEGEGAVLAEGDFAEEEVAEDVGGEEVLLGFGGRRWRCG